MPRRWPLVLAVLCTLLMLVAGVVLLWPQAAERSPSPRAHGEAGPAQVPAPAPAPAPSKSSAGAPKVRTHAHADAERVRAGLAAMAQARGEDGRAGRAAAAGDDDDSAAEPGELNDRVGLDPKTVEALSNEFLPLTDECITQARQRDPALTGMLAVEVDMAGDPELGAVIEDVRFPEQHDLGDDELRTCIRETAMSMVLPSPEQGGREQLLLTVPIEDE